LSDEEQELSAMTASAAAMKVRATERMPGCLSRLRRPPNTHSTLVSAESRRDLRHALGGPEAVVAIVETIRRQVADGSLVGFTDKDEFQAHLRRSDRRSA